MEGTEKLSEIIWIAPEDFKTAMLILKNEWKFEGKETYAEAEDLDDDEIDPDDDEYYEMVEYYEKEDGSSAEVYLMAMGCLKKTFVNIGWSSE